MRFANPRSAVKVSEVKSKLRVSWTTAAIIIPLSVGSLLLGGRWHPGGRWLGQYGGIGISIVGLLLAVFLEINLISWRLGIPRELMFSCGGLNLRGKVESYADRVLSAYSLLRKRTSTDHWFRLKLDRLVHDLFKALDALSHYPAIDGFHRWEDEFAPFVDRFIALAHRSDLAGEASEDETLDIRLQLRRYFDSILQHMH